MYKHRDSFDIKLENSEESSDKKPKSYGSLDTKGNWNQSGEAGNDLSWMKWNPHPVGSQPTITVNPSGRDVSNILI